ncbi:MAG: tetratricopeptide repeat protein [Methylococcales bacterium]
MNQNIDITQQKNTIRTAIQSNNFEHAKQLLMQINATDNVDGETWQLTAYVHVKLNDIQAAIAAYQKAIQLPPENIDSYNNLGFLLQTLGQFDEAIKSFQQALKIDGNNLNANYNLALAHASNKNFSEAEDLYQKVINLHSNFPMAYINLANIYRDKRRSDDAIELYRSALKIDSSSVLAHINLATLLEKIHDLDEAKKHCDSAISLQANSHIAILTLATINRRQGNIEESSQLLEKSISLAATPTELVSSYSELGKTQEKLHMFDDAFSSFTLANQTSEKLISELNIDPNTYQNRVQSHSQLINNTDTTQWTSISDDEDKPWPIFLIGFPRSGTTLTEQILVTHPNVVSSEEAPIIPKIVENISELLGCEISYPNCIPELSTIQIETLREQYWNFAESIAGDDVYKKRFLDKQPLNITELSLLYRMFPDANYVVLIRDPRDVCLSCYSNSFATNQAMANFNSLNSTVSLYKAVMQLWEQYRTNLPSLSYLEVKYENLVDDMPSTSRKIFEYINEEWDDTVLEFFNYAKDRYIKTPSYENVSSPIYSTSIGRWKNYTTQLKTITPELESLVKHLGYE